jgi:predicted DNA-binding transcriptional regulator AlpA
MCRPPRRNFRPINRPLPAASTDICCLSSRCRAASWRSARGKGMHSTEHHRKLNSPEAAEYLGISVSTLSKRRVDGDSPKYLKLGRRVVYDTRDLDGWLDTRRRASTADVDPARLIDAAHADARPGRRPPFRNGNTRDASEGTLPPRLASEDRTMPKARPAALVGAGRMGIGRSGEPLGTACKGRAQDQIHAALRGGKR